MRYLLSLLVLVILSFTTLAQKHIPNAVDSIQTRKDALAFITKYYWESYVDSSYEAQHPDSIQEACFRKAQFYKIDIDRNGRTDLIEAGRNFMVLRDTDTGFVSESFGSCDSYPRGIFFEGIDTSGIQPLLMIRKVNYNFSERRSETIIDTIVFKYNALVEYNNDPGNYQIDSIHMQADACFGTCPVFDMSIHADGQAIYKAEWHTRHNGFYKGAIPKQDMNELFSLINYIEPASLKDDYSYAATDQPAANLTIYYNGNKVKKIHDYGKSGTYGLSRLYDMIENWDTSQTWTKIGELPPEPKTNINKILRKYKRQMKQDNRRLEKGKQLSK